MNHKLDTQQVVRLTPYVRRLLYRGTQAKVNTVAFDADGGLWVRSGGCLQGPEGIVSLKALPGGPLLDGRERPWLLTATGPIQPGVDAGANIARSVAKEAETIDSDALRTCLRSLSQSDFDPEEKR